MDPNPNITDMTIDLPDLLPKLREARLSPAAITTGTASGLLTPVVYLLDLIDGPVRYYCYWTDSLAQAIHTHLGKRRFRRIWVLSYPGAGPKALRVITNFIADTYRPPLLSQYVDGGAVAMATALRLVTREHARLLYRLTGGDVPPHGLTAEHAQQLRGWGATYRTPGQPITEFAHVTTFGRELLHRWIEKAGKDGKVPGWYVPPKKEAEPDAFKAPVAPASGLAIAAAELLETLCLLSADGLLLDPATEAKWTKAIQGARTTITRTVIEARTTVIDPEAVAS